MPLAPHLANWPGFQPTLREQTVSQWCLSNLTYTAFSSMQREFPALAHVNLLSAHYTKGKLTMVLDAPCDTSSVRAYVTIPEGTDTPRYITHPIEFRS